MSEKLEFDNSLIQRSRSDRIVSRNPTNSYMERLLGRHWDDETEHVEDAPSSWEDIRPDQVNLLVDQTEVRIIDPETGGEKGAKRARFDLVPPGPLYELAEHYGIGVEKYSPRNWERGYDWSLSFAALQRHAWAWWNGEDLDPEFGDNHLVAVAWHAFALLEFTKTHPEKDDRPS